nr:collagen alpha-1(VI) chain-like [Pocillopora verrucosa]
MFRLFFVLALAFLLSSFAKSKIKSANQSRGTAARSNCCASQAGYCKDGKDGKDGQNGKDGRDGINGDGEKGEPGMHGVNVNASIKGERGEPGQKGENACFFIEGEKGSVGQKGSQGQKGQKGMPGTCDDLSSSSSSGKRRCCKDECSTGLQFFEKVLDLPTREAVAFQHFTFNGSLFLTFGYHYGDVHKYKTSFMIYNMDESTEKLTFYDRHVRKVVWYLPSRDVASDKVPLHHSDHHKVNHQGLMKGDGGAEKL